MRNLLTLFFLLGSTSFYSQSLFTRTGATHGVVVGISDYQDEEILDVSFADTDAQAFADFLCSTKGGNLSPDQLKVLLNQQATGAQIALALDWLEESSREGDQALLFYTGHGHVQHDTSAAGAGFLLGWDTPSNVFTEGSTLSLNNIQRIITALSSNKRVTVTLIVDACLQNELKKLAELFADQPDLRVHLQESEPPFNDMVILKVIPLYRPPQPAVSKAPQPKKRRYFHL
ncbi:MAG: caspase family protein [Saprospirales bacterium]|nr:caspase family protein [Saprospirales bacterium]